MQLFSVLDSIKGSSLFVTYSGWKIIIMYMTYNHFVFFLKITIKIDTLTWRRTRRKH